MPLTVRALKAHIASVDVEYGDETFEVRYRPHKYTDEMYRTYKDDKTEQSVNNYLLALLSYWDIRDDDDGPPWEVTKENLAKLSLVVKLRIVQAIEEDLMDPKRMTGSSSGTPPAASSSTPNGAVASPIGSA